MTNTNPITRLEKLIEVVKPETVSVMLEVKEGHTFDDSLANGLNTDKLDKLLWEIESHQDMVSNIPEMETYLVYKLGVPSEGKVPSPAYAFLDPKFNWDKIRKTDLAIIFRLDWKIEVVHTKEGCGVTVPSTLDWVHSV
ncbi:hypothetical protein N1M2_232 [Klebsiella phage N1M2]|uniref:Uncharacterized protein n=1 Tax=Klebsiella phage N1M2 TaxID=2664939 RepID=A0A6B7ZF79_9CAUD|nr:hypothetical protein PQB72_gp232 [Klebsiella phage N1M2]QGH72095.1 hypothetical protein N1M2_232 [Klebsiella phage N1M2]